MNWEYQDYVYSAWDPGEVYSCVSYRGKSWIGEARDLFWDGAADDVYADLQRWWDAGWESVDEVGPDAILVSQSEQRESANQISDVLLWIMTLGTAFILQYWLNTPRRITVYKPVEFRLKMRRLTHVQAVLPEDQGVLA